MKKLIFLFASLALVACGDKDGEQTEKPEEPEEPEEVGITPVPVSDVPDEVAAFFEEYLNNSNLEFYFGDVDSYEEVCFMINNAEEFKVVVLFAAEVPYIDFDKYTLVVGQYITGGARYLSSQSLVVEQDMVTMNITVDDPGGLQSADVRVEPFWGLYPKINAKSIRTNVTYQK